MMLYEYIERYGEDPRDFPCEDHDMRCEECGATWWGDWTRGSRIDPPEPRRPDCPECGA